MSPQIKMYITLLIVLALFSACGGEQPAEPMPAPAEPESQPTPTEELLTPTATPQPATDTPMPPTEVPALPSPTNAAASPEVVSQGFLLEGVGFQTPESVLYDPEGDVYLVANINGSPSAKDGNGFISRISPGGELLELKWIDGGTEGVTLNAPKGMALAGDRLYVADIDTLRAFDRETGEPLEEIPIEGAQFLNDVAAMGEGTVYITDSAMGAIHRIDIGGAVTQVAQLDGPNGIDVSDEAILVASVSQIFRFSADSAQTPVYELPVGGLDGLVLLEDSRVLVSSWEGSTIYMVMPDGTVSELFGGINAPADIGFDTQRSLVLIPHFMDNRVEARPMP